MAVRIYALAKDLKIDSKELVDICTRAGVPGKGSALASLTEDEVEKVTQFLKGGGPKAKSTKTAPPSPQRPTEPARTGKMPVIVTAKPAAPAARPISSEPVELPLSPSEPVEPRTIAASSTAVESATATATAVAVETARRPGPLAGAMGREKYIGPGQATGKVPVVGRETKPAERKRGDGPATTERARPAVKLAPLPKTSRSIEQPAVNEPPAQKPDLRLPADVLGAGKQGSKPLAAHLRRHERTLEEEKKLQSRGLKVPRGPLPPAPAPTEEEKSRAKGKHRRGKDAPDGEAEDRPMLGGREQRQLARRRTPKHSIRKIRRVDRWAANSDAPPSGSQPLPRAKSASAFSCHARFVSCRKRPAYPSTRSYGFS